MPPTLPHADPPSGDRCWQTAVCGALAGGMAWGVRGQYGHETGAMIAGLLVSLVIVRLLGDHLRSITAARSVAWCTVAMGFGGSMTYGQTIGLTQDAALIGHWDAWRWGMLGLAIKGGIWIGFAGTYLGMGLGGVRYRAREILALALGLLVAFVAGTWLLNQPFDPAHRSLPRFYFSADWYWRPDADLKPRRELWGGMLLSVSGLLAYVGIWRRDGLALRLGGWGLLGGALGFPLGQCLQSYHAWNAEWFRTGPWAQLDAHLNWWNFMETTFGAVMGASLGFGAWRHRRWIQPAEPAEEASFSPALEWLLLAAHLGLLLGAEFSSIPWLEAYTEFGLLLGLIPLVAIAGGRWWPYALALPITAAPIAGKTLKQLVYEEHVLAPLPGWLLYVVVPMTVTTLTACYLARGSARNERASSFARPALLLATWLYFGLNFAFFRFPWPWEAWTARTPNAIVFSVCAGALTALAWRTGQQKPSR